MQLIYKIENSDGNVSMSKGVNILHEWIIEQKLLCISKEAASQLHTNKGLLIDTKLNWSGSR